jgi:hypothetical protein
MEPAKIDRFLEKGNFARFAAMSFPQADLERFTVGFEFYIWAFMVSLGFPPLAPCPIDLDSSLRLTTLGMKVV